VIDVIYLVNTMALSSLKSFCTLFRTQPVPTDNDVESFTLLTTPTLLQRRAFDLLGVSHRLGYA
jgi:hypothetical protein